MRVKITLRCNECKQRNYNTMKNKKNSPDRLEMNKYCPFCRKHTVHTETKRLDEKKGCVTMAEVKKVKKDRGKWFREMRSELKKVVWPDGKTTAKNTGTVLLCSLGVGVFIWVFDAVAVLAVKTLVGLFAA